MYRPIQLSRYCIITRNNVQLLDREIQCKNEFSTMQEAVNKCNELNEIEAKKGAINVVV